jgi:hypothetical protein
MRKNVETRIKAWLTNGLATEVTKTTIALIKDTARPLTEKVSQLERKYGLGVGTLGQSLMPPEIRDVPVNALNGISSFDPLKDLGDIFGPIIGVVVAAITVIVISVVTPVVITVLFNIVSALSVTLGALLLAALSTNPVGWAFLIAAGLVVIITGQVAAEEFKNRLPGWDLPNWARKLVNLEKIRAELARQRTKIITNVTAELTNSIELKNQILKEVGELFEKKLRDAAEDARMLIR